VSRIDDESRAQTQTPGDCYNTALAQGCAGNKQWRRKPNRAPGYGPQRETRARTTLTSFIRYTVLASHTERQITTELDFRCVYYSPAVGGGLSDTAICPSICVSACTSHRRAAALGYRHAGCLQLSQVRIADPSAGGRRSVASRTAIGGRHIVSPSPGRYLVSYQTHAACTRVWASSTLYPLPPPAFLTPLVTGV